MTRDVSDGPKISDESVIVVIPCYNERENIASLIQAILALGDRFAILVVDDSSPDGTGEIVLQLAASFPHRVELLTRSRKQGIGRAYVSGFTRALENGAQLIAQMDADHSHQPLDLERLVDAAEATDLVLASRYIAGGATHGWPWHRKLISRAGGLYAGLILGVPIKDLTGGFKVWRRETLRAIELESIHSDGYCFQIETTFRALRTGFSVSQIPITFTDRVAGKSKLSRRVVIEAAFMVWRLRFRQIVGRPW